MGIVTNFASLCVNPPNAFEAGSKAQKKSARCFQAIIAADALLGITAVVLGVLGAKGVIGISPAASFTLIGAGSLNALLPLIGVAHGCKHNMKTRGKRALRGGGEGMAYAAPHRRRRRPAADAPRMHTITDGRPVSSPAYATGGAKDGS